ncbi:MAG: peptidoglycan-binding protein LysM [Bacteroidota bacterium]
MGLFSFLKKSGAKVLTKKNAKSVVSDETKRLEAELLRQQKLVLLRGVVDGLKIKAEKLKLDLQNGVVTVYGKVPSQSDREKIVLALGNVSGVEAVDDRLKVEKKEPKSDFYQVKKGDSLSKIAKKYYGDPMKYKAIFKANKPMLKDPDKIYPGQTLRIPRLK